MISLKQHGQFYSVPRGMLPLPKFFVQMIKTQFLTRIKSIRLDNAFELGNNLELREFSIEKRIIQQTSGRHSPQLNGVVERENKKGVDIYLLQLM